MHRMLCHAVLHDMSNNSVNNMFVVVFLQPLGILGDRSVLREAIIVSTDLMTHIQVDCMGRMVNINCNFYAIFDYCLVLIM